MTAGRNPLLREDRIELPNLLRPRSPDRPLADFERWIERQEVPLSLGTPPLSQCARDAARALWGIVQPWLARGISTRHYPRHRVITVFGTLQYRVINEGKQVEGAARWFADNRLLGGNLPIDRPLQTWGFTQTLLAGDRNRWKDEVSQLFRASGTGTGTAYNVRAQAGTQWAEQVVDRYLHRLIDVQATERRIRHAMNLDLEVLRMAYRIEGSSRGMRGLNTSMYQSFQGLLPDLLEVERLEPVLTPLAWATLHQWSKLKVSPLQYLRNEFANRGVGPEGWRRLRAFRARPVWRHWCQIKIAGPERLLDFLADWARIHDGLPLDARMPWPMWDTLARTAVEAGDDRLISPVVWPCRPAVLRAAIDRWSAAPGPEGRQAFIDGEWTRVVRWAAHYGGDVPAGRKTTWAAVLAAAKEDERLRLAQALASDLRWECPIKPFTFGDVTVVPLTDPVALTEEALALRHCADTWVNACAEGKAQVFGFRDAKDGRRVATLALRRTGDKIELEDLRRLANRQPTEKDRIVADVVVERVRTMLAYLEYPIARQPTLRNAEYGPLTSALERSAILPMIVGPSG